MFGYTGGPREQQQHGGMVKLAVFGGGSIGGFVGAANLRWLEAAFARARKQGFRGVMLFMQANPRFEDKRRNGFSDTLTALERETLQFAGQVGLVHGDSHYFRIDKPLVVEGSRVANFTRLETFGPPDAHWIRAAADPRDPVVFQFEQRIVAANVFRLELPDA